MFRRSSFLGLLLAATASVLSVHAVTISEFMAINDSTLQDEDGAYSDWVELYNESTFAVDLDGWYLTDDSNDLTKWPFPATTLQPGEYRVVFASSKNRRDPAGELHTNFKLSGSGEYLALVRPDGTSVAHAYAPAYPEQQQDVSYGITFGEAETNSLLVAGAACRAFVPMDGSLGTSWLDTGFNDSGWLPGTTGVGYDYGSLVGLDIENEMHNRNQTVYIRIPFNVTDASAVTSLALSMRFEDGFAAYINGQPVAEYNAPDLLDWNSAATALYADSAAVVPRPFAISNPAAFLIDGPNVLAFHGLNFGVTSSDFLLLPELDAVSLSSTNGAGDIRYFITPSPGTFNLNSAAGFVADTKFSVDRGFFSNAFNVAITSATANAVIRYTTDGSWPTESHGTVYSGEVTVSQTTILRAAAFKDDFEPSDVDTQTYIFPAEVPLQPVYPTGFPSTWGSRSVDYQMDPDVVTNPLYAPHFNEALTDIPTMSLVADMDDLFSAAAGIYANPGGEGLAWERAASIEIFYPDGTKGTQANCGVRIQGGASRSTSNKKHSFRLLFKSDYGPTRLKHDLFGFEASDSFNTLVLRAGYNDAWANPGSALAGKYIYIRDSFVRDSQVAIGHHPATHGTFVHLYVNGLYWGIYNPSERPDAAFNADYLGGDDAEYDVFKHMFDLQDGTIDAWNEMYAIAQGGLSSAAAYQAIQEYMDVDSLIDYMMLGFWAGSRDWLPNNWYAARRRAPGKPFLFYEWDMEFSLRDYGEWSSGGPSRSTYLDRSNANCPAYLYHRLRDNADFVQRFGDRAYKHLYNDGAMTPSNTVARLQGLVDTVETAMIAESARWGDVAVSTPRTVEASWRPVVNDLLNSYLPGRRDSFINDLRGAGTLIAPLYPDLDPPTFSHYGGHFSTPLNLTMGTSEGTIYYTTDGSDPRLPGGTLSPTADVFNPLQATLVDTGSLTRVFVPTDASPGSAWTSAGFDDGTWMSGALPIGFDRGTGGMAPLAHYTLNETSGTVAEDSGPNGWDGTYGNGVLLNQSGVSALTEGAAYFDGSNDYVDLTPRLDGFRGLSSGTISAWFKTSGTSAHAILTASDSSDASSELRLFIEGGALRYNVRGDSGSTAQLVSGSGVNDGQWRFAAVTVDGGGMAHLYLDGAEVASGTRPFFSAVYDLDRMALGRNEDSGGAQWHFVGTMDEVRIYDTALNAEQIGMLYNTGTAGDLDSAFAGLVDPALADPLADAMIDGNATAYCRIPFSLTGEKPVAMALDVRYEDGFVAYLNGVEVARRNAPAVPAWDSAAPTDRSAFDALTGETLDLTAFTDALVVPGDNVLAVQVLNSSADAPELFAEMKLTVQQASVAIDGNIQIKARVYDGSEWSPLADPVFTLDHASPLRISEVMVAPYPPTGSETNVTLRAGDFEFIELHNTGGGTLGLAGYSLSNGVRFSFTGSGATHIPPDGRVVVVNSLAAFTNRYPAVPLSAIAGEYEGDLNDAGESLSLDVAGMPSILTLEYSNGRDWPLSAQGAGHSLVPLGGADQTNRELDHGANWRASALRGGSPGAADPSPLAGPCLNEFAAHTDYDNPLHPEYDSNDWIELFNTGTATSLTDWYLSDSRYDLKKWAIPSVSLPAGGWIIFDEVSGFHAPITSGFGLNKAGEELYLSYLPGNSSDRVADAVRFKGQDNGWTLGRVPDGTGEWIRLSPTPAAANGVSPGHVVISEVMYHPRPTAAHPEDNTQDEYIALHNPLGVPVPLFEAAGPWRLAGEIDFTFPGSILLGAGEQLLVVPFDPAIASNRTAFLSTYGVAEGDIVLYGPYAGKLSNHGGRLALERPQEPDDPGELASWVIVDEIFYFDRGPWPALSDGTGMALHRSGTSEPGALSSSWQEGMPSPDGLEIAPEILRLWVAEITSTGYQFEWDALPGVAYRVEATDTLFAPVWMLQGSATTSSNGVGRFTGPLDASSSRFFRLTRPE